MGGERGVVESQHSDAKEPKVAPTESAGSHALHQLMARGRPSVPDVVSVLSHANTSDQQQLIAELHQSLGNDFVQQVLAQMPESRGSSPQGQSKTAAPEIDASLPVPSPVKASANASAESALTPHAAPTPAQRQSDGVERLGSIYDSVEGAATGILGALAPAYQAARDQRDVAAVAELGGRLLAAFSIVHGGKSAFDQLRKSVPHKSVQGTGATEDLDLAKSQADIEAKAPLFDSLIPIVDAMIANTLTPHQFQGKEVAGQPHVVDIAHLSGTHQIAKLSGELQRTLGMLVLVDELKTSLFDSKKGLDKAQLAPARMKLLPWATRPLDLAFLRAALGPLWDLLDATATEPMDPKLGTMLADSEKQAKHTGWLGDVGRFDINNAVAHLHAGGRGMAETVLGDLYTTDPDTRAGALMQIKQRGLLDALCSAVGWADIKNLHDSLGGGFAEIKTDLQKYFIGDRKYGPSLDSEWENHDYSLHGEVGQLGPVGSVLNFALDLGTFGFNSSYGKAIDDNAQGLTSDAEMHRAKTHAAVKTAVVAAVSLLTGGAADKAIRGTGAAVSTGRAIGGGVAGGGIGAGYGLAASDAYDIHVSGDKQEASSPLDYVKAVLLGGAMGGVLGGVAKGLSNRAGKYLPKGGAGEPPSAEASPEPQTTSEQAPAVENAASIEPTEAPPRATPQSRELGLRPDTVEAIASFENIKADPIGRVNQDPNSNHYKAARREAAGDVVARRPDGTPYDHIRDLQEHYNGLDNARTTMERELQRPSPNMTERGLEVLLNKYSELQRTMSRLKGFLDEIGHSPPFPPFHQWPPGA